MEIRLQTRSGFTLIELSIVLVIIGLIVGGVLVGRDMIRQAEIRSMISDIERYITATNTFRIKYNCLPGDCPSATQWWGTVGSDCTIQGTGTQTADGNGDGMATTWCESFRFWQQLSNAEMIKEKLTGVAGGGGVDDAIAGTNVPRLAPSVGISATIGGATGTIVGTPGYYDGYYGNTFDIGKDTGNYTSAAFLRPSELKNIDTKMDDGNPGTGVVRPRTPSIAPTCTSSVDPTVAAYNSATDPADACNLMYLKAF
jgi:prepilin-type N-terminal cleavage/methylation domain-containing protein